jgi:sarcosine oxidase subunit gamma
MADPIPGRTLPSVDALLPCSDRAGRVGVAHAPFPGQVGLRLPDLPSRMAAEEALGVELPQVPNRISAGGERLALWLGPDEWLILAGAGSEDDVLATLDRYLAGLPTGVVDLSANRTALDLEGPDARFLLSTMCALDFHLRAFLPGDCAQTIVAGADTIVLRPGPAERYRLLVRPSFARHVVLWMRGALESGRSRAIEATPAII